MPRSSMPLCWKKRLSSAATNAFWTNSGIAHAGQLHVLDLGSVGKIYERLVVEANNLSDIDGGMLYRLVLAELPVCGEQLVEFQAM